MALKAEAVIERNGRTKERRLSSIRVLLRWLWVQNQAADCLNGWQRSYDNMRMRCL